MTTTPSAPDTSNDDTVTAPTFAVPPPTSTIGGNGWSHIPHTDGKPDVTFITKGTPGHITDLWMVSGNHTSEYHLVENRDTGARDTTASTFRHDGELANPNYDIDPKFQGHLTSTEAMNIALNGTVYPPKGTAKAPFGQTSTFEIGTKEAYHDFFATETKLKEPLPKFADGFALTPTSNKFGPEAWSYAPQAPGQPPVLFLADQAVAGQNGAKGQIADLSINVYKPDGTIAHKVEYHQLVDVSNNGNRAGPTVFLVDGKITDPHQHLDAKDPRSPTGQDIINQAFSDPAMKDGFAPPTDFLTNKLAYDIYHGVHRNMETPFPVDAQNSHTAVPGPTPPTKTGQNVPAGSPPTMEAEIKAMPTQIVASLDNYAAKRGNFRSVDMTPALQEPKEAVMPGADKVADLTPAPQSNIAKFLPKPA